MENNIEQFVKSLDIPYEGKFIDKYTYQVDMEDSDEFSKLYHKLSDEFETIEDLSARPEILKATFTNGEYNVYLIANFDYNVYRMTVEEA